jgi:dephospho-CoA kinase
MRIAITGGIAEGKSEILKYLRSRGANVISADQIAREIMALPATQSAVRDLAEVDEVMDATQLRYLLSIDDHFRRKLNQYIHPKIAAEIEQSTAMFVEIPLLLEACLQVSFDVVWVVTCGIPEQIRRVEVRYPGNDPLEIISTQISSRVRIAFADAVIETDSDLSSTLKRVDEEVKRWGLPLVVS